VLHAVRGDRQAAVRWARVSVPEPGAEAVDGTFTQRLQSLRVGRCSPSAVEDPVGTRPLTTRKRDAGRENNGGRQARQTRGVQRGGATTELILQRAHGNIQSEH